jgi:HSP20 family protein
MGLYGFGSPWREMERIHREMNRLFYDSVAMDGGRTGPDTYPPVNVWTNEDGAVVMAELPGFGPEDIEISVIGETLTLSGSRQPEELKDEEKFYRRERSSGSFTRTFRLPFKVNADAIEAVFEKGVLQVSVPRLEADKPRKINVKGA